MIGSVAFDNPSLSVFQDAGTVLIVIGAFWVLLGAVGAIESKWFTLHATGTAGRTILIILGLAFAGLGVYAKLGPHQNPQTALVSSNQVANPNEGMKDLKGTVASAGIELGSTALNEGDRNEAEEEFFNALYLVPDNPQAIDRLNGLTQGDKDKADGYFLKWGDQLKDSDPGHAKNFVETYMRLKKENNEYDPQGYYTLGLIFNQLAASSKDAKARDNLREQAAENFGRGIKLIESDRNNMKNYGPTRAYINKDWGYTLISLNRCGAAVDKFNIAIQFLPNDVDVQSGLQKALACSHAPR